MILAGQDDQAVNVNLQVNLNLSEAEANRIIRSERISQRNVAAVGDVTRRSVVDLPTIMGRPGGCAAVRAGLAIRFTDTTTGSQKEFKAFVDVRQRGQLRSIFGQALQSVVENVLMKYYLPSFVNVMDFRPGGDVTLESLECQ